MKLYKINNIDEYIKVFQSTMDEGTTDFIGSLMPIFITYEEVFRFFDVDTKDIEKIFYDNGDEKWDVEKENLPKEFVRDILNKRINLQKLKYPFYLSVAGAKDYLQMIDFKTEIFYEVQSLSEV